MAGHGIEYTPVTFEKLDETEAAFLAGRCDAFAMSGDGLSITRSRQPDPSKFKLLPDRPVSLETHAMIVRGGDQEMLAIANWVLTALLKADELGITSDNLDEVIQTRGSDPQVAALLGLTPGIGKRLGLSETWAQDVIRAVGSYSQIYDRNLGTPYEMPAGFNAVYSNGGLLYPLGID
jgi:general L-amino acid transport system substrate-binding protein